MNFGFWVGGTSPGFTAAPVSSGVVAVGDGAGAELETAVVRPVAVADEVELGTAGALLSAE
jgi:hypothetical protein